ncbi:hypothetical protein [Alishewanella phage vB_AspM_Slicko01]|nr:hypothetical protein [Alishewanella phage vB_AspM_Slicko01]
MYSIAEIEKLFRNVIKGLHDDFIGEIGMNSKFSKHFCERVFERMNSDADITNTVVLINRSFKERICEILYALHVPYDNVWLNFKNYRVILSLCEDKETILFITAYKINREVVQKNITVYNINF